MKANDASTTLKRDLEGKVALKMEEECKCSEPVLCQKMQAEKIMNYNEYDMGDTVFSSQRNSSLAIGIPSIVQKTVCTFSRRTSESNDFFLVHCYLSWRIQTIVYFALGSNHRLAKISETALSALQSL